VRRGEYRRGHGRGLTPERDSLEHTIAPKPTHLH
jgi:hypothetical protein